MLFLRSSASHVSRICIYFNRKHYYYYLMSIRVSLNSSLLVLTLLISIVQCENRMSFRLVCLICTYNFIRTDYFISDLKLVFLISNKVQRETRRSADS